MTSMRGAPVPGGGAGAGVRSILVKAAMRNAAVLPVPVCDWPATSLPRRASGSAPSWIGVMVTKPASRMPSRTGAGRSSPLKSTRAGASRALRGGRGRRRRRAAAEDARTQDPDLVEDDDRTRHQRLVERVGRRREHGAGDERAEDGVLAVL